MIGPKSIANVALTSLVIVAPASSTRPLPPVVPWKEAVPLFSSSRSFRVTDPLPPGAEMFNLPAVGSVLSKPPLIVPGLVQVVLGHGQIIHAKGKPPPLTVRFAIVSVAPGVTLVLKLSVPPVTETLKNVGRTVPVPKTTVPPLTATSGPSVSPVPKVTDPPVTVRPPVTS